MKRIAHLLVAASLCFAACSKSSSTNYTQPQAPAGKKRLIKFTYEGNVFGILPMYEGLADTPKHRFEATGITESQFVKTMAGDTIRITLALSSEGTKPLITAMEDKTAGAQVPQQATEIATNDGTRKFRIVVQ